ncbi:DUF6161 domain-containing protein [Curvivirga sp.]|uniref:DUF6161 domain-containing protein n=1 Tax=Curvivirga sp. TaxID=2856848 RepID=UPI003B5CFA04
MSVKEMEKIKAELRNHIQSLEVLSYPYNKDMVRGTKSFFEDLRLAVSGRVQQAKLVNILPAFDQLLSIGISRGAANSAMAKVLEGLHDLLDNWNEFFPEETSSIDEQISYNSDTDALVEGEKYIRGIVEAQGEILEQSGASQQELVKIAGKEQVRLLAAEKSFISQELQSLVNAEAVSAPLKYWKDMTRKQAKFRTNWIIALVVVLCSGVLLALMLHGYASGQGWYNKDKFFTFDHAIVFGFPLALLIMMITLIIKQIARAIHMGDQAYFRVTQISTYLSLLKAGKMNEDERHIALQAVFKDMDGNAPEVSHPIITLEAIQKMIKTGAS